MATDNSVNVSTIATAAEVIGIVIARINPTAGFVWGLNVNSSMQLGAVAISPRKRHAPGVSTLIQVCN